MLYYHMSILLNTALGRRCPANLELGLERLDGAAQVAHVDRGTLVTSVSARASVRRSWMLPAALENMQPFMEGP